MKYLKHIFIGLALAYVCAYTLYVVTVQKERVVACTAQAMMCPDGSAVGRTGPECRFAPCPDVVPVVNGAVTVGIGQTAKVGDVLFTVDRIVGDSRCPSDVTCIQAGTVSIRVTFKDSSLSKTTVLSLGSSGYVFGDYIFSLSQVDPVPVSTQVISPSEYHVSFHIERKMKMGLLVGTVFLSPTCPVEQADSPCLPKPYSSFVTITGAHNFYLQLHTDTRGVYKTMLPEGDYIVLIHQTTLYPRCDSHSVTIHSSATSTVDIACDSGIR